MTATTYAGRAKRDGITVTVTLEVSDEASYADQDELAEMMGPAAVQTLKRVTDWRTRATVEPPRATVESPPF